MTEGMSINEWSAISESSRVCFSWLKRDGKCNNHGPRKRPYSSRIRTYTDMSSDIMALASSTLWRLVFYERNSTKTSQQGRIRLKAGMSLMSVKVSGHTYSTMSWQPHNTRCVGGFGIHVRSECPRMVPLRLPMSYVP